MMKTLQILFAHCRPMACMSFFRKMLKGYLKYLKLIYMFTEMGMDPTVVVGSFMNKSLSNFRKGKSEYFIVEADEYNRHFLNFFPFVGLVTNVEADHLDCYKDLADIQKTFDKFLSQCEHTITEYSQYISKVPELAVP